MSGLPDPKRPDPKRSYTNYIDCIDCITPEAGGAFCRLVRDVEQAKGVGRHGDFQSKEQGRNIGTSRAYMSVLPERPYPERPYTDCIDCITPEAALTQARREKHQMLMELDALNRRVVATKSNLQKLDDRMGEYRRQAASDQASDLLWASTKCPAE
jgi:hypothetical protein